MGPPLFCLTLVPIISKLQQKYEQVIFKAHIHDITLHLIDTTEGTDTTEDTLQAMTGLVDELEEMGIVVDRRKARRFLSQDTK